MTEPPLTADARALAEVLWDYHRLADPPTTADALLVLGSHDLRVAEHAADLWTAGRAPLVVFSGGRGKVTEGWDRSEASVFADLAADRGVPRSAMLLEESATNTGENITLSRAALTRAGIRISSAILVAKPYMARRALATALAQWPGVDWSVGTPPVSFAEYTARDASERRTIELIVGDLQRIKVYADLGYQAPMPIPPEVWDAYEGLVRLGFDRYVLAT
ncbi:MULTISPECIES: YdcF family protein [unclassified Saccharothrix]|uniref:YdcF family protein n=1 Tax=unclassified Saccharothrix TaxID=2593673 RepID=UPI00307E2627